MRYERSSYGDLTIVTGALAETLLLIDISRLIRAFVMVVGILIMVPLALINTSGLLVVMISLGVVTYLDIINLLIALVVCGTPIATCTTRFLMRYRRLGILSLGLEREVFLFCR